jgi:hypothetical protein
MRTLETAEKEAGDETAAGAAAKTATEETMARAAISSATTGWWTESIECEREREMARIGEDMQWAIALSCEVASGVRWSSERGRGMMAGQGVKVSGAALIWISWLSPFG